MKDTKDIVTDLVNRELDSFVKYSLLALAAVVTFFLYIVEHENDEHANWSEETLPNIIIFGLQLDPDQFVYAILLIPLLQLVLLRPLQGILDLLTDLECDFNECKGLLSRSPSVFNPYHSTNGTRYGATYWLSLIAPSGVIVFFPSVVFMIWLTEVTDGDFVFSTTIFGLIVLAFLFLQVEIMARTWFRLFGRKNMLGRLSIMFFVFIGVGCGVYAAIT